LSVLLSKVEKINKDNQIVTAIGKYVKMEKIISKYLKEFFEKNNSSPDNFFHLLKYPTDKNFVKMHDFFSLKYRGEKLLPLFKEILADVIDINNAAVKYARKKGVL
jgi:hypothetical protein